MARREILTNVACAGLAAIVAGCASTTMVKSYPTQEAATSGEYVGEYGLARTLVTVTLTAPEAAAAAPAANPTSPTVTFNSTINVTTAAQPEKKDGAGETQATWCAGLRKAYNQDRLATLAAPVRHVGLQTAVAGWIGQSNLTPEEVKARVDRIGGDVDAIVNAIGAFDRARVNAPLIEEHCPQPFKVTITDSLEIDPGRTYRLYAQPDAFSNDRLTTEFEGGYLKTISATGDDRAADVLTNAVKTLASIQTFGAKPKINVPKSATIEGTWADPIEPEVFAARAKALVVKIRNDGYNDANLKALLDLLREYRPGGALEPIDVPLPVRRTFLLSDLDGKPVLVSRDLRVVLITACSAMRADPAAQSSTATTTNGIWVSAGRSCVISVPDLSELDRTAYGAAVPASAQSLEAQRLAAYPLLSRTQFWALDSASPMRLPLDRTAFVRRATGYTFANGRMTKSDVDRPGEAAEVVALPLKLITAFTGAVAEGIRGETAASQAETARIQAETARIQAQLAYEAARKAEAQQP